MKTMSQFASNVSVQCKIYFPHQDLCYFIFSFNIESFGSLYFFIIAYFFIIWNESPTKSLKQFRILMNPVSFSYAYWFGFFHYSRFSSASLSASVFSSSAAMMEKTDLSLSCHAHVLRHLLKSMSSMCNLYELKR